MAMLGINPSSQYQGGTSTLDRIAKGVDIATKLVGTGAGLYKTFAADIPQAQAQTEYLKSENAYKQGTLGIEMAKMGFMPVDTDHVHVPDVSSGPGAVQMQQNGVTVQTNQAAPNVMKVGNKAYMQVANPQTWTDQTKSFIENMTKQGYTLTSDSDPDPTKKPYVVPGMPFPMHFKQMGLDPKEANSESDRMGQDFLKSQSVQRFNNIDSAANMALHLMNKLGSGTQVTKSDDIALTIATIRAMNPDSNLRFNNDNVEGFKGQVTPGTELLLEQLHKLYDSNTGLLPPEIRNQMLGTVQKTYEAERPNYDQAAQIYQNSAQTRGLQVTAPILPNLFGAQAKSPGMAEERQRSSAGFQQNFPTPTPAPHNQDQVNKAKQFFGIGH